MRPPNPPTADEAALVGRLQRGDPRAYRILSEQYLKRVLNYSHRLLGDAAEAEDVAQETFLRFWQQAPKWEPRASVATWLFRVAHNQCMDRLRKRKPTESDTELLVDSAQPARLLERRTTAMNVHHALDELPPRQRGALVLSHWDGLGNAEIAEILELSVDAVESLLARGRRALRQRLAATEQPEPARGRS